MTERRLSTSRQPGSVKVELLDIGGRRVASAELAAGAGTREVALPVDGTIQPGSYVVRVTQGGASAVAKLIVVR